MPQIFYQSDMENIHRQFYRQSEVRCCPQSQQDCPDVYVPQTWLLPTPGLPGSHRLREGYTHGMNLRLILQKVPFQLLLKFPVRESRLTYPHQEYVSYPGVPVNKNRDDEVSLNPPSGSILFLQERNKVPELYDL